jgi:hypothetical protein
MDRLLRMTKKNRYASFSLKYHMLMIIHSKEEIHTCVFVVNITKTCLIHLLIFIEHPSSSGMWLGVAPRINTKKICVQKRLLKLW